MSFITDMKERCKEVLLPRGTQWLPDGNLTRYQHCPGLVYSSSFGERGRGAGDGSQQGSLSSNVCHERYAGLRGDPCQGPGRDRAPCLLFGSMVHFGVSGTVASPL